MFFCLGTEPPASAGSDARASAKRNQYLLHLHRLSNPSEIMHYLFSIVVLMCFIILRCFVNSWLCHFSGLIQDESVVTVSLLDGLQQLEVVELESDVELDDD